MTTGNKRLSQIAAPGKFWTAGKRRQLLAGLPLALLAGAAMALSTAVSPARHEQNISFSSVEGNIIVAFDVAAHSAAARYRVDCNAVVGGVQVHGEAASSPVVVGNLIAGNSYDCHARIGNDAQIALSRRVQVIGQD